MDELVQTQLTSIDKNDFRQVWDVVSDQLRIEMSKPLYEAYVQPLRPRGYESGVFTLAAENPYMRDWVESRVKVPITRQLEGLLNQKVVLNVEVNDDTSTSKTALRLTPIEPVETETAELSASSGNGKASPRRLALQRAYGSKRAAVVQPERSLMITQYFFGSWLPLIGHSAMAVILAALSMCYWNPLNGELRNEIETEMGQLAERAAVSVRTVKSVLNDELVRKYFLRYRTRRVMTPNGVRTAGILLLVRMDDPLTPDDQVKYSLPEDEFWFAPEYGDSEDED
jgi:hypothetical protein